MIRPCWITCEGEVIHCPNAGSHQWAAGHRFPDVMNPEEYAEKIGWIKITGYNDPPRVWCEREPNQLQHDAMFQYWPGDYKKLLHEISDVLGQGEFQ